MSAYSIAVLADSPTAYWRLGESTGTSAADSSGNGNTITASAVGVLAGHVGALSGDLNGCGSFNGSTDLTRSAFPQAVHFTIEAWVNPTGTQPNNVIIAGDSTGFLNYALLMTNTGVVHAQFYDTTMSSHVIGTVAITSGIWTHVAATYDGSTFILYLNGVSSATLSVSVTPYNDSAGTFAVGAYLDAGVLFTGFIDEVALYPTALSAARILAHYTIGTTAGPLRRIGMDGGMAA